MYPETESSKRHTLQLYANECQMERTAFSFPWGHHLILPSQYEKSVMASLHAVIMKCLQNCFYDFPRRLIYELYLAMRMRRLYTRS